MSFTIQRVCVREDAGAALVEDKSLHGQIQDQTLIEAAETMAAP